MVRRFAIAGLEQAAACEMPELVQTI